VISYKRRRTRKPRLVVEHQREIRLSRPHRVQLLEALALIEPATADEIARAIGTGTWACEDGVQKAKFAVMEMLRQLHTAGEVRLIKMTRDRRKFFALPQKRD